MTKGERTGPAISGSGSSSANMIPTLVRSLLTLLNPIGHRSSTTFFISSSFAFGVPYSSGQWYPKVTAARSGPASLKCAGMPISMARVGASSGLVGTLVGSVTSGASDSSNVGMASRYK